MTVPDNLEMQLRLSRFETLVEPAIVMLLSESQGTYRCERDLHHHVTACLNRIRPLCLGSKQLLLHAEQPAVARYGTGRHGNIDFFLADASRRETPRLGIALEINWNYNDPRKVERDFCKLIDPSNAYTEAAYFAYGTRKDLLEIVQEGLERAVRIFREGETIFLLPSGLSVLVAVRQRDRLPICAYSAMVRQPCTPSQLRWTEVQVVTSVEPQNKAGQTLNDCPTTLEDKIMEFKSDENRDCDGPSYQTAPLTEYQATHQQLAEALYAKATSLGVRTKKFKGSYSAFAASSLDTTAKVIIYEESRGRVNGASHLRSGVYALVRKNGTAGERNTSALSANGLLNTFPSSDTIGIAPAHKERFRYVRVDDTNLDLCVQIFCICAGA